ncbi:MAG: hypothetical protein GF364_15825 [Candidatus Lokiarchaeota archaeon]|nr:hypothetical protein [Candidatus Lokiarchaeota archaeon]
MSYPVLYLIFKLYSRLIEKLYTINVENTDIDIMNLKTRSSRNAWFLCYHIYSTSNQYSPKAVAQFELDLKYAVEKLDVEYVIIEDYFDKLVWGEYANVWSEETLKAFIKLIHDYGAKFLPYTNATELSITGQQYPKHGRDWGAKTSWGKIYAGYASIFYPSVYIFPEYEWYAKIMCAKSGWKDFLLDQIRQLHENYELDGLYLDRVDYRVPCYDHNKDPKHFEKALPGLVREMQKINKSVSQSNILIVNDSCMQPDYITEEIFGIADGILSELLLADMNPYGIDQKLAVRFVDLAWKFKWLVRTILTYLLPVLYHSKLMTNKQRMQNIIKRIRDASGDKDLWLFSHQKDKESIEFLTSNIESENTHLCFCSGVKRLRELH